MTLAQLHRENIERYLAEGRTVSGGNTSAVDFSGLNSYDPLTTDGMSTVSSTQESTIDSGSNSGVPALDWGGLINDIGSTVSKAYTAINGQPIQRLPNGQVLLPSGQVVSQAPVFSSGSTGLLLLVGLGLVLLILIRK